MGKHDEYEEMAEVLSKVLGGKHFRNRDSKKLFFGIATIVIIAVLISIFFGVKVLQQRSVSPAKNTVLKSPLPIPAYYPKTYPSGYYLDESSIDESSDAKFYAIKNDLGDTLYFSVQKKPSDALINDFESSKMVFATNVSSPVGKAVIGSVRGNTGASITTDNAWILVTTTPDVKNDVLKTIVESLNTD